MKNTLLFTYSTKTLVRLLTVSYPKNPKMCDPILVTLLCNLPGTLQLSNDKLKTAINYFSVWFLDLLQTSKPCQPDFRCSVIAYSVYWSHIQPTSIVSILIHAAAVQLREIALRRGNLFRSRTCHSLIQQMFIVNYQFIPLLIIKYSIDFQI